MGSLAKACCACQRRVGQRVFILQALLQALNPACGFIVCSRLSHTGVDPQCSRPGFNQEAKNRCLLSLMRAHRGLLYHVSHLLCDLALGFLSLRVSSVLCDQR